jgi:hypothetical protein
LEAGQQMTGQSRSADTDRPAPRSVLLSVMPHVLQAARSEPALVITFAYLFVAMAGIFYNFNFYEKFDIPILALSQVSDFLVAGLQQPMALLLVLSTFPLCWLFDKFNLRRRRQRHQRLERLQRITDPSLFQRAGMWFSRNPPAWFTGCLYLALVVIYGWLFVHFYARHRADLVRTGEGEQVLVTLTNDGNRDTGIVAGKPWSFLGTTSGYVYLYDRSSGRSVILPLNNIVRIEPVPSKSHAPTAQPAP